MPESLYTAAPEMPRPIGTPGWELRVAHDDPDVAKMNRAIQEDLAQGADGVLVGRHDELARRLEGVDLERIPVSMDSTCGPDGAEALLQLGPQRGCLGFDPLGFYAQRSILDIDGSLDALARVQELTAPGVRGLCVDTAIYQHAGATDPQDLSLALATVAEYARAAGTAVLGKLELRIRLRPTLFASIAKLRALRLCWDRMAQVLGVEVPLFVHVRPSLRWLTLKDPHNNLLRNTVVVSAGALGGADAISSVRLDSVLGMELAGRVARNTQIVLREEAHLGAVRDPAGGSYAIESLTYEQATEAWSLFQEIESGGGLRRALDDGTVAKSIDRSNRAEQAAMSSGSLALLGVTHFPPAEGAPEARLRQPGSSPSDLFPSQRLEELA